MFIWEDFLSIYLEEMEILIGCNKGECLDLVFKCNVAFKGSIVLILCKWSNWGWRRLARDVLCNL